MHFSLKIRHLVATTLMIFLRVLPKKFLWPHYSGVPGACGPRFIEPPEPPVPTPLCELQYTLVIAHGLITLCPSSVQRPSTGFDSFDEFADHSTTNRQPYWFTPSLRPGSTILQSAVGRSSKVCYRQVAAGHERCSASCEQHEEVRPRLDTPALTL